MHGREWALLGALAALGACVYAGTMILEKRMKTGGGKKRKEAAGGAPES
jgi:hypothetical protein